MRASRCFLSLLLAAVALATAAAAQRVTACDDTEPLRFSCDTELAAPQAAFHCGSHKILALQEGCYRCVNAVTCKQDGHGDQAHFEREATPQPTIQSEVVPLGLPFVPDALSMTESAQLNAANMQQVATAAGSTQSASTSSSQEASNWYFLVPAALALVSLGLAVRSRVDQRAARFDRLDKDDDEEEEINPFCSNGDKDFPPQEEKGGGCADLELAAGYDGASDDDAIFGPARAWRPSKTLSPRQ